MKVKQSMEVGHINNVTFERTPTGKCFVVLNVDFDRKQEEQEKEEQGDEKPKKDKRRSDPDL